MPEGKGKGSLVPTLLGILTIAATIAAAIPSFLQLSAGRAKVRYRLEDVSILNPQSPDTSEQDMSFGTTTFLILAQRLHS